MVERSLVTDSVQQMMEDRGKDFEGEKDWGSKANERSETSSYCSTRSHPDKDIHAVSQPLMESWTGTLLCIDARDSNHNSVS